MKKTYGSSELVLELTNLLQGNEAITSGFRPLLCVPTASPRATNSCVRLQFLIPNIINLFNTVSETLNSQYNKPA